jgi:hypothetical protein
MVVPGIRNICVSWLTPHHEEHHERLQPQGGRRVRARWQDHQRRLEQEIPEFIKYLNDEVVPSVRKGSTKALRAASEKLTAFADYMEKHPGTTAK